MIMVLGLESWVAESTSEELCELKLSHSLSLPPIEHSGALRSGAKATPSFSAPANEKGEHCRSGDVKFTQKIK